jgi:hypothetical protein
MIDYTAIYAAIYNRAGTDSAGAAVRALLGAGSQPSLFSYQELGNLAGRVLPYLVWRPGAIGGRGGDQRTLAAQWVIYCKQADAPRTLHEIAKELETLYGYTNRLAISGGELVSNGPGQPFPDKALGCEGMIYTLSFLQRG